MELELLATGTPAFEPFGKIARLSRDCIVTEKIDGTNAQVCIVPLLAPIEGAIATRNLGMGGVQCMFAGSRTRWITPADDNFGFAKWVADHAEELFELGPGHHYGEWWGSGIQRKYGLTDGERRWSLFNVARWHQAGQEPFVSQPGDPRLPPKLSTQVPPCCHVVPVLYRDTFDSFMGHSLDILDNLRVGGSLAAPGFMNPEGIVVLHVAGGYLFKKTLEKDEQPKGK